MHPVQNEAALFLPEHELLVVADLHIGIEYELRKYGVYINSRVERLAERIKQIASKVKATKLLILGDVKHVIPSSPKYQQDALIKFFHEISKDMDVYMVPGNHDGGLKKIVEDISIFPSDGWFLEDMSVGFFHGHRWPNDHVVRCKTLVAAHTHPTVTLKDSFGYKFIEG
ncbi:MAG TPA: hypothetical protein ENG74_00560 [Thermoplasmatales archaeon]|nr:hypothetical protein [Thermoplasmatales archaeon]